MINKTIYVQASCESREAIDTAAIFILYLSYGFRVYLPTFRVRQFSLLMVSEDLFFFDLLPSQALLSLPGAQP